MTYEFHLSDENSTDSVPYHVVFIDADNADEAWGLVNRHYSAWQCISLVDTVFNPSKKLSWNDRRRKGGGIPKEREVG